MYFLQKLKFELAVSTDKVLGRKLAEKEDFEYPPKDASQADLALPCFKYAKELKKSPAEAAEIISKTIKNKWLEKAEARGPYVNFYLKRGAVSEEIIKELQKQDIKNNYVNIGKGERVMIEYVSPNSNKPLHLGHIRNGFLGEALSNILEFTGHKIKRTCLVNDRGVAICKSMLAYKLWGKGDSPKKSGLKSDHFVGKYYVLFDKNAKEDPSLLEEVQKMLQKWEQGDKLTVALWKKMTRWALDGYKETYKRLGINFDKSYFESELYQDGQKIAGDCLAKNVFSRDEKNNVVARLEDCGVPDKVLLRADGTAVYATTDLALAKKRLSEGYKKIFYIVGSEQDVYFKQLFCILKKMDLERNLDLRHLSYGLVELPEGKMKSREGTVVDADDLLNKMEDLVEEEVKARHDFISQKEIDKRTAAIAAAALKFYILDVNPGTTIHFNPKESISFTGKTGPYLLYSYARLHSIWRKGKNKDIYKNINYALLQDNESWNLVWEMAKFPEAVLAALAGLDPEEVAAYLYGLSTKISDFYHKVPVLEADLPERRARLAIIDGVLGVLKKGFLLLGIEPLEEM